jgi:hypothetical protein
MSIIAELSGSKIEKIISIPNSVSPSLAADAQNNLHYIWEEIVPIDTASGELYFTNYYGNIWYQKRIPNGEVLDSQFVGKGFFPEIKILKSVPYILFIQADSLTDTNPELVVRKAERDSLSAPVTLHSFTANVYGLTEHPVDRFAWGIDSAGGIHCLWREGYPEKVYALHYPETGGIQINSTDGYHTIDYRGKFMPDGKIRLFFITQATYKDTCKFHYAVSAHETGIEEYGLLRLTTPSFLMSQIIIDTAGSQHAIINDYGKIIKSYLIKNVGADAHIYPLTSVYLLNNSNFVDSTNRVWLTGENKSANVILNFSLDDVGSAEDFSFPLHVGDLWQYRVVDIEDPSPVTGFRGYDNVKAVKDTAMPNGESYILLKSDHGYILTDWYLRRNGLQVFQYSSGDSTEYLLYDFSKGIGDTIGKGIIQDIVFENIFGSLKKTFMMNRANTWSSSIADSIGISSMATGLSYDMQLTGAVINGKTYGTIIGIKEDPNSVPFVFSLYQNYPNPFNPFTKIRYEIPTESRVLIKVFDILGREAAALIDDFQKPGRYEVEWNAGNFASGVYFYSIKAGDFSAVKKLLLLK